MDDKKYVFTGKTIKKEGKIYSEIMAAEDMDAIDGTHISKGTILGAIEDESCLSQDGLCIIYNNSFIDKGIVIREDAVVKNSFLRWKQISKASAAASLDKTVIVGKSILNRCNLELRLGHISDSVLTNVNTIGSEIFHSINSALENCSFFDCLFFNSEIENLMSNGSIVFKNSICRIKNNTSYLTIDVGVSRSAFYVFENMFVENTVDLISLENKKYVYKRKDKKYALSVTDSLGKILTFSEEASYVFNPYSIEEFLGTASFYSLPHFIQKSWNELEDNAIENFVNGIYGSLDEEFLTELKNLARVMQYCSFKEMIENNCSKSVFCNGLVLNLAERKIAKILPEYFYIPSWGTKVIGERRQRERSGGFCVDKYLSS